MGVSLFSQNNKQHHERKWPQGARGALDWILGKNSPQKSSQPLEQAAQGSAGITISGSVEKFEDVAAGAMV